MFGISLTDSRWDRLRQMTKKESRGPREGTPQRTEVWLCESEAERIVGG